MPSGCEGTGRPPDDFTRIEKRNLDISSSKTEVAAVTSPVLMGPSEVHSTTTESCDMSEQEEVSHPIPKEERKPKLPDKLRNATTLEVFSGSGNLSRELARSGFKTIAIDYAENREKPVVKTRWLDLVRQEDRDRFWSILKCEDVVFVHLAPPCGTSTRARDIRRKKKDGTPADIDPQPLRSEEFPLGLPNLPVRDLERVQKANNMYEFAAGVSVYCELHGIAWMVENPDSSYMWLAPCFKEAIKTMLKAGNKPSSVTCQMSTAAGGPTPTQILGVICINEIPNSDSLKWCRR